LEQVTFLASTPPTTVADDCFGTKGAGGAPLTTVNISPGIDFESVFCPTLRPALENAGLYLCQRTLYFQADLSN